MLTTKLSTKGQVILPKAIREAAGLQPGTEFTVEKTGEGILLRPLQQSKPARLEDLFGILHVPGRKPATIADMDRAVADTVRERHARGRY